MFFAEMIAPCGLNCGICKRALQKENPCLGCRGPQERKSNYCMTKCSIWKCEKLSETDGFCDQCSDYPCEEIIEKENRYASMYPLKESPIENLSTIRKNGMTAFLQTEETRWSCPSCGATVCVHSGVCSECGKV